jgi:hypothetical protein
MAQTKRKRRTKHRGTPAGTIETRGRTGRKPTAQESGASAARSGRESRFDKPPTWRSATIRAGFAAVLLFFLFQFIGPDTSVLQSGLMSVLAMSIYVPLGYFMDRAMYNRRQRSRAKARAS